jgi:succinate dehydrogenase / fumarate reductase cytochrome b subunit
MWMWLAHRATGVAVFFFLLVHVLDTALVRISPDAYNSVVESYKNPFVGLVEAGLVAVIVFHGLNGLRIIAIDASRWALRRQTLLSVIVIILWAIVMAGFLPRHLGHVFGGE